IYERARRDVLMLVRLQDLIAELDHVARPKERPIADVAVLRLAAGHFLGFVEYLIPRDAVAICLQDLREPTLHQALQSQFSTGHTPSHFGREVFSDLVLVLELKVLVDVVSKKNNDIELSARFTRREKEISGRKNQSGQSLRVLRLRCGE